MFHTNKSSNILELPKIHSRVNAGSSKIEMQGVEDCCLGH